MRSRGFVAVALTVAAVFGGVGRFAHADVKLEQTTTQSGLATPGGSPSVKSTFYFKGDRYRSEDGNTVTIYNGTPDHFFVLDTAAKTYYESTIAALMQDQTPAQVLVKFTTSIEATDTGEEKQIAGQKAHHYRSVIKFVPSAQDNPTIAAVLPSLITMFYDEWTMVPPEATTASPGVQPVPSSYTAFALYNHALLLQTFYKGTGTPYKEIQTLLEKMAVVKGLPVENKLTMTVTPNPKMPGAADATTSQKPLVRETKATALKQDTLPDSLFAVPSDYKKVDAPVSP